MSPQFQFFYPILKNIFEHLPLEKRLEITRFCPSLETAEKSSVLHLEVIGFNRCYFRVDQLIFGVGNTHSFEKDGGDYCTRVRIHRNDLENIIYQETLSKTSEELWKGYLDLCLNRETVKVRQIDCRHGTVIIPHLPEGLKIECQELKLYHRQLENIRAILPFLTGPFPEKLSINFDAVDDLLSEEEELLKEAKFLVVSKEYQWNDKSVEKLTKLQNEKIHIETEYVQFAPENVMKIAESWLIRCPDVRTQFTVEAEMYDYVLDVMDLLKNKFKGVQGEVLEEKLSNSALRHCVTIQMRSGYELNIFGGVNMEKKKARWWLRMEVMMKGSSIAINRK